eukprot:Gb_16761 [translate_table: standard]
MAQESARYSSDRCLEVTLRWIIVEFRSSPLALWLRLGSVSLDLVTGLHSTSRISVFALVGLCSSKGCVLSYLVFEAASGDPLAAGGLVKNCHHFRIQGRRDMNHRTFWRRSPSLSSSVTRPVRGSFPHLEEATEPNVACTACTVADVIINGHTDLLYRFLGLTSSLYSLLYFVIAIVQPVVQLYSWLYAFPPGLTSSFVDCTACCTACTVSL